MASPTPWKIYAGDVMLAQTARLRLAVVMLRLVTDEHEKAVAVRIKRAGRVLWNTDRDEIRGPGITALIVRNRWLDIQGQQLEHAG